MGAENIQVSHLTARQYRYLLVDASRREDLPAHWPQQVVAPAFLGDDTSRCPALIDLQSLDMVECAELCATLEQQVQDRSECLASLMLAAPVEAKSLAAFLRDRMVIRLPGQGGTPKQFRFFDPGTFLQLPDILGDAGMNWLMGLGDAMLVPWAGQWTVYQRPVTHQVFAGLTPQHIQELLRLGVVNRVAGQLPESTQSVQAWQAHCRSIAAHARRAFEQYGLAQQDDQIAFASHAMTRHPRFDIHPRIQSIWQSLMNAAPEDELNYRDLSAQLQEDDWAEVTKALNQQQDKQEARRP